MSKVILGGGLSGLSAAYYLLRKNPASCLTLIESSNRLGGWIKSNQIEDVIFEEAARTLRPRGEPGINTLELIDELGLSNKVNPITLDSPAARNRMIYANGQLVSLPSGIKDLFVRNPPFSKPLIRHFIKDLVTAREVNKDESIYSFTKRRFGEEVADYLISPLICGICAGDAKEISVNFIMKDLFEYEQKYGSIGRGMMYALLFKKKNALNHNALSLRARNEKWSVYSLNGGLETLTKTLSDKIRQHKTLELKMNSQCKEIKFGNPSASITLDNGSIQNHEHVISSIPSYQLSNLIKNSHPELSSLLNNIKYVSVCVINLMFDENIIKKDGFGFLVPPKEKIPILGVIFDSCCFPNKTNKNVVTVMMGGKWFEEYFSHEMTEEELLTVATKYLKLTMNVKKDPVAYKVNLLKDCIPQYKVGHNENVHKIEDYIKKNNIPLTICGCSYYGVGVNDVILSTRNMVQKIQ
ncbi:unnamed protein product [Brassicogethes aeneus]|uniref:Protoporphyrinogen oxidase n=1 Tax=Brassicogethes aeneus TaxID=1431903 RepID=A0A9P0AZJ0_BRAAE|nr:unnamed protein product [Brassicogethes aeneus]